MNIIPKSARAVIGLALTTWFAAASAQTEIVINEILQSTTGTDVEYFELFGPAGASLEGLSIIAVEAEGASVGQIDDRFDFVAGDTLGDNGFYLWGTASLQAVYGVTPNREFPDNTLENSATTFALVETASLSGTSVSGSEVVLDAVATIQDVGTFFFDAPVIGPDGTFLPAGVRRVVDGVDTDTAADWVIADFGLGPDNTPTPATGLEPPAPGPCDDGEVFIHQIQGSGDATECDGVMVTVTAVVVGDYEGPSPALRGFYLQEEDEDQDGDPATSEGIFVFHGNVDSVKLGDQVRVTGEAGEFQGQTQIGFPDSVEVLGSGFNVTPAEITLPVAASNTLEAVEGMLVVAPQALYVTEHFQLGRFGQVVVSSGDRLQQPTNVVEPGAAASALQAENDLNRLIVDDAENRQNPDPILLARGGNELTASNTLRGGDTAMGTVGVMTYTWAGNSASGNAYRLRPIGALSGHVLFEPANPRPAAAPDAGGSMTVASFNVLNYFLTIDTGPDGCGPTLAFDCRGADSVEEFERQRVKLMSALSMLGADVVGLIELENTPDVSPEADIASGLNDIFGAGTYAAIDAAAAGGGVVGTDAIRVGLIYKPGVVTPLGDPALLDFSLDALGQPRSRTAVAHSFTENATGEVITVVVNHLKSKSGSEIDNSGAICSTDPTYPDCDQGDGQGYFNAIRTAHAQELVDWLATDPTGSGDGDVMIVGDLNAYGMEDPIDAITNNGYTRLTIPGDYSFVFDGQWGSLDHALASPSLAAQVAGFGEYHINADEPNVLDYNTNFKSDNHVNILFAPDEFRTSDHDPLVVGLAMASGFEAAATPDELWPPNHKLRDVTVTATDGSGAPLSVEIVGVISSEADCCIEDGDKPDDINIVDNDTVQLRAERYSRAGRTYTISVRLSDGNQSALAEVTVTVPHDQGKRNRRHAKP